MDTVESVGVCLLFSTCVFSFADVSDALVVEEVVENDAFTLVWVSGSLLVKAVVSEVGGSYVFEASVVEVDASSLAVTLPLLSVTLLSLIVEVSFVSVVSALESVF